jgi:tetratricopeptide (TPR) repeat protein
VLLSLMEGRLADAERLVAETLAMGERAERWNAHVSGRLQLFVLRRAQGRLAEVGDTIRRAVHEYPTLIRFSCALAHLYSELGDTAAARSVLDDLAAHDLTQEYVDAEWLFTTCLLPDVYRALADEDGADRLYRALVPYEPLYAHAPIEATFGSVARALGVLATTTGRFDEAERHFMLAIRTERQMRAWPWLAHAQHDFAEMLALRGEGRRAAALAGQALDSYRELGMESWAERVAHLI